MKATGIVRRIDDLGRVVIPKEIRRSMGIKENDPLEIFVEKDRVIFQRYMPLYSTDLETIAESLRESVANSTDGDERTVLNDLLEKVKIVRAAFKKAGY